MRKPKDIGADLMEALALLNVAGPNPLLINADEYWDRYHDLTEKYFPDEEEQS